jgi:hypothetical protein
MHHSDLLCLLVWEGATGKSRFPHSALSDLLAKQTTLTFNLPNKQISKIAKSIHIYRSMSPIS